MNPVVRALKRVDQFQQNHTPTAVGYGIIKKYGDDNAGVLASNLAYSAFATVFPLLLLLVTLLGIFLGDDASARRRVLNSALRQFPVIGTDLGRNISALQRGSPVALTIAIVGLVWSSTGLAQAGQFAMSQIWDVPGPQRPGFLPRATRSFAFLATIAAGLIITTTLASLGAFSHRGPAVLVGAELLAAIINTLQYLAAFRVLTPKVIATRRLWPGAVVGGVGWSVVQATGGYLVGHNLRNASEVYGTFAIVLGLLAWIYIGAQLSIYSAELNVVLARHLWPRAIVQPPLTEADQRSLAAQVRENQRRSEQNVSVQFTDRATSED